jgi:hypothetical protein
MGCGRWSPVPPWAWGDGAGKSHCRPPAREPPGVDGLRAPCYPIGHAERDGPGADSCAYRGHRVWEAVRAEATAWAGVTPRRRFGRDGLSLHGRLFACGPGAGDDLWVRLTLPLQRQAVRQAGVLPHPRFARTGWIVLRLRGASGRLLARRWPARAYAAAGGAPPEKA